MNIINEVQFMLINSLVLLIFLLSFIYSIKYKFIQLNLYKQCKEGLKNKKWNK